MQGEKSVKRFSEVQLLRANRAFAALSDPARRRKYDEELRREGGQPGEARVSRRADGRSRARAWITLGWLVCAFAGIVGIGWYMSQPLGAPPAPADAKTALPAQAEAAPKPSSSPAQQAPASRTEPQASSTPATQASDAQAVTAADRLAPPTPAELHAAPAADPAQIDSLNTELTAAKSDRDKAAGELALATKQLDFLTNRIVTGVAKSQKGFTGVWVLPKRGAIAGDSSYAPEAADLIVSETAGILAGQYRARYPTMGRPEQTAVCFFFEGARSGNTASLAWNGTSGAKGDVQLRLITENSLELVWSANEKGQEAGPGSGTVLLVRKREP